MATDLALLRSATSDILGLTGNAVEGDARARAQEIQAQGATEEEKAYGTAGDIARRNAQLEGIVGDIQGLQQQREVRRTIGEQRAGVAAAGFASSGSSLDLLGSSLRQGYLGKQLIDTQTALSQGGYLQQGAATDAEIAAVQTQSRSALSLADAEREAAATSRANAANQAGALQQYLKVNPPSTPQEKAGAALVTSSLNSPLNGPASLPPEALDASGGVAGGDEANPFGGYRVPNGFGNRPLDQFGRPASAGVQLRVG